MATLYYNWLRPHSAHNDKTPFSDEALKDYDVYKERIQDANYKHDLEIA